VIVKRLFDLLVSIAAVIIFSPVMALAAIWIKADSSGPVFFRQERIGRGGVPFYILKFRTMAVDTSDAADFLTGDDDKRITRSGHFLRKCKIDEFPQFFNVILGQMSVVGPRPEVRKYVELYPNQIRSKVLSMRPGITDNASILYRNEGSLLAASEDKERVYREEILPKKLDMYVEYVKDRTFLGDMQIIFRTILSVISS
jgi:lipopolysaccharide/colanic/teichoic acid biosynthesis glycosyltransferase